MAVVEVYTDGVLTDTHTVPDDPHTVNRVTIEEQAQQALEANRLFLALASPTQAQSLAQIRSLTRQNQRLIRLALGLLDGTD